MIGFIFYKEALKSLASKRVKGLLVLLEGILELRDASTSTRREAGVSLEFIHLQRRPAVASFAVRWRRHSDDHSDDLRK